MTPADSHRAVAEACLRAGRHCFIEKPLTVSVADGRAVAEVARATARVVQVGHIFRFHPVTAALRAALAADRIGAVRYATGRFSGFKRPRTDVGVTHTDAIHYFDLFASLLGREASSVAAVQRDYLGRGLDDMSVTTVTYGDVPAIVEANYFVPGTHRECVIVGERGSLVADYGASTVTLHAGEHHRRGATSRSVWSSRRSWRRARAGEPIRCPPRPACTRSRSSRRPRARRACSASSRSQRSADLGRGARAHAAASPGQPRGTGRLLISD